VIGGVILGPPEKSEIYGSGDNKGDNKMPLAHR
jgi:hypothetical protein